MNTDKYISELLYQYDCVIIPGFGGFIANYSSAKIHPTQHIFSPPSKIVSFNKNLVNNDGLLANHIAQKKAVSYAQANDEIKAFVEKCFEDMQSGKKIELEKVGALNYDNELNIQFEPDRAVNYLTESFGLTTFRYQPLAKETIEKKIENKITNGFKSRPSIPPAKRPAGKINMLKYAKITVASAILIMLIWVPMKTNILDNISLNYSALNPFADSIKTTYIPRTEKKSGSTITEFFPAEQADNDDWIVSAAKKLSETEDKTKVITLSENRAGAEAKSEKKLFHVIGGCFQSLSNAKRLIRKLKKKGFDAKIVDRTPNSGLYRVSYSSHESREEALAALEKVRGKYLESAWLLAKKE